MQCEHIHRQQQQTDEHRTDPAGPPAGTEADHLPPAEVEQRRQAEQTEIENVLPRRTPSLLRQACEPAEQQNPNDDPPALDVVLLKEGVQPADPVELRFGLPRRRSSRGGRGLPVRFRSGCLPDRGRRRLCPPNRLRHGRRNQRALVDEGRWLGGLLLPRDRFRQPLCTQAVAHVLSIQLMRVLRVGQASSELAEAFVGFRPGVQQFGVPRLLLQRLEAEPDRSVVPACAHEVPRSLSRRRWARGFGHGRLPLLGARLANCELVEVEVLGRRTRGVRARRSSFRLGPSRHGPSREPLAAAAVLDGQPVDLLRPHQPPPLPVGQFLQQEVQVPDLDLRRLTELVPATKAGGRLLATSVRAV